MWSQDNKKNEAYFYIPTDKNQALQKAEKKSLLLFLVGWRVIWQRTKEAAIQRCS